MPCGTVRGLARSHTARAAAELHEHARRDHDGDTTDQRESENQALGSLDDFD